MPRLAPLRLYLPPLLLVLLVSAPAMPVTAGPPPLADIHTHYKWSQRDTTTPQQVIETLRTIYRDYRHYIRLSLVVPSFFLEPRRKDRGVMTLLNRYFRGRVAEPIRTNVKLAEAPSFGQTIFEYDPNSSGAEDYARLVERIADDG